MNNVINEELDFGPSCGEITVVLLSTRGKLIY